MQKTRSIKKEEMKTETENIGYTIKDMPEAERPQEKLLNHGPRSLSAAELLALIIRTGNHKESAIDLATRILYGEQRQGLTFLAQATPEELMDITGVKDAKASKILATVELGRRTRQNDLQSRLVVDHTRALPEYLMDDMQFLDVEEFRIALLDVKKRLIGVELITKGILNSTVIHPREVFHKAINRKAHTVILIHNHPSGNPSPSQEDIKTTQRMVDTGKIIGIPVIDHIIIGNHRYYSFVEEGLM